MFRRLIIVLAVVWFIGLGLGFQVKLEDEDIIKVMRATLKSLSTSSRCFVFIIHESSRDILGALNVDHPFQVMESKQLFIKGQIHKHSIIFVRIRELNIFFANRKLNGSLNGLVKVFIILDVEVERSELEKLFEMFLSLSIVNVNVLTIHNGDFIIASFSPYQDSTCKNSTPIVTNVYHKATQRWQRQEIFPNKLRNFHQCPLRVSTLEYPPSVIKTTYNGALSLQGSDIEVIKGLSTSLNFSLNFAFVAAPYDFGEFHANGSVTGAISRLASGEADIVMGFYFMTYDKLKHLSNSNPYFSVASVLIIPMGRPFSSFEKLIYPFQSALWLALIIVVVFSFGLVALYKFLAMSLRMLSRRRLDFPFVAIVTIIVGGSHNNLPQRNHVRLVFASFLLFSLVLRSLYQGALFQFLKSDKRNSEIHSIDEMMAKGFHFFMYPAYQEHFKDMKFYERRVIIGNSETPMYRQKTLDPYFKGAVCSSIDEVVYLNEKNLKNFTYLVANEYIKHSPVAIYFPKNSFLVDAFNEKLDILKAAGLIDFWIAKFMDLKYLKVKEADVGPRQMKFEQLNGIFCLLLVGCAFGFIAFVCEVLTKVYRKKHFIRVYEFSL